MDEKTRLEAALLEAETMIRTGNQMYQEGLKRKQAFFAARDEWIVQRVEGGESQSAIARELSVTRQLVHLWFRKGQKARKTSPPREVA